jgi:sortase A
MVESNLSWVGEQRCSRDCHARMTTRPKILAGVERLLGFLGVLLLSFFVAAMIYRQVSSRLSLRNFDENQSVVMRAPEVLLANVAENRQIDLKLWSQQRIEAYRASLSVTKNMPLAVLRLNKFKSRVPVFEGTDELVLNRGAGWIEGTARPGETGNIGIAGHRDGFFRVLKDIAIGDAIELSTTRVKATYMVDEIEIVNPHDVGVLRPRRMPSLTLTTCYPFYFVGDAPQRFIVHAALRRQIDLEQLHYGSASARANQSTNHKEKEK